VKIVAAQICLPMPGEIQNGDAVLVRESAVGHAMLAVVDGLGHGPDAAAASRKAIDALNLMSFDIGVLDAMQELHSELRGTRGAAATLCIIKDFKLEICAVGNVSLMCVNCTVPLVLSAGVLGHQVARFRVAGCLLPRQARLALLSDGVSVRFRLEDYKHLEPHAACQEIVARYRRKEDDATVLVADVRD
jgi:negative regulator of sigma-B (phosphoserine phosphatase)